MDGNFPIVFLLRFVGIDIFHAPGQSMRSLKSSTPLRRQALFIAAAMFSALLRLEATPVVTFNEATGGSGANQNQSVGWQFDVVSPIVVTALGWFDSGADGLSVSHTIGIWASNGQLLASAVVPAGTSASLDGQFRVVPITPFTLAAGSGYIVGGENFSSSTDRLVANATQTVDPHLSYVHPTFANLDAGFTRPTMVSMQSSGFYGPSFSTVPEPSSFLLVTVGAFLCVGLRRGR